MLFKKFAISYQRNANTSEIFFSNYLTGINTKKLQKLITPSIRKHSKKWNIKVLLFQVWSGMIHLESNLVVDKNTELYTAFYLSNYIPKNSFKENYWMKHKDVCTVINHKPKIQNIT